MQGGWGVAPPCHLPLTIQTKEIGMRIGRDDLPSENDGAKLDDPTQGNLENYQSTPGELGLDETQPVAQLNESSGTQA